MSPIKTEALFKLVRAVDKQLGGVPAWKQLLNEARAELGVIELRKHAEYEDAVMRIEER
jgi:hypothetical protein